MHVRPGPSPTVVVVADRTTAISPRRHQLFIGDVVALVGRSSADGLAPSSRPHPDGRSVAEALSDPPRSVEDPWSLLVSNAFFRSCRRRRCPGTLPELESDKGVADGLISVPKSACGCSQNPGSSPCRRFRFLPLSNSPLESLHHLSGVLTPRLSERQLCLIGTRLLSSLALAPLPVGPPCRRFAGSQTPSWTPRPRPVEPPFLKASKVAGCCRSSLITRVCARIPSYRT